MGLPTALMSVYSGPPRTNPPLVAITRFASVRSSSRLSAARDANGSGDMLVAPPKQGSPRTDLVSQVAKGAHLDRVNRPAP